MMNPVMCAIGRRFEPAALATVLMLLAKLSVAQAPEVSVKMPSDISVLESSLRRQSAAGDGLATAFLEQYPQYYTQLIVRTKSGEVEIHQNYDELMIIEDGGAAAFTGGAPQNLRTIKPGELRGKAASGSTRTSLTKGTLAFIPAGTPHQVIVPEKAFVVYIDVKIAHR